MTELLSKAGFAYGFFSNPWPTWENHLIKAGWVMSSSSGERNDKNNSSDLDLDAILPVQKPVVCTPSQVEEKVPLGVCLTWLGHATTLFSVDGVNVLCDPVFSERCSAVQFMGPKRLRPTPCKIDELPAIDVVVISHNHYDHLDVGSIAKLGRNFPKAIFLVPSGCLRFVKNLIHETNSMPERVYEAVWWQEFPICQTSVKCVFTPTQHWSGRNLVFDYCRSLWGSWAIIGPTHKAWFAGDTGYCSAFKEIGAQYGPFDVAAIPIGAYKPRELLKFQHVNPSEAVKIHEDVKATHSIGIHWGTFPLGHEAYLAPKIDLAEAVQAAGLSEKDFKTINIGQSFFYRREPVEHTVLE